VIVTVVNIHDAKTHLSKLLDRMLAGEDIVIAKAGKPLARLIPVDARLPRTPGLAKGRVTEAFFDPLPEAELKAWEA
jgi:prevent-host-death family protein